METWRALKVSLVAWEVFGKVSRVGTHLKGLSGLPDGLGGVWEGLQGWNPPRGPSRYPLMAWEGFGKVSRAGTHLEGSPGLL